MSNKKPHAYSLFEEKWHNKEKTAIYREFNSSPNGLSNKEAKERLSYYGPNILPTKKAVPLWKIVLHQIINPLIFMLIIAAFASIAIGEPTDAIFIFCVIVINTSLGAYQEFNAEKSASSLQKMLKIHANVLREGKEVVLPSEELVPGDIVVMDSGDKVPADMRLFETFRLMVDESFLTGESIATEKNTALLPEDTEVSERKNMVYAGSTINSGRGIGMVTATGSKTQVGMIAETVAHSVSAKPPLVLRITRFTRQISIAAIAMSIGLSFILLMQGYDITSIFFLVVALAVSAIPEGLPVALIVALSIAAKRMARKNVIVRKLVAVESLGSCTIIASDKTGTLTVNQQTARKICLPHNSIYLVSGEGYNNEGDISKLTNENILPEEQRLLQQLAIAGTLANEASLLPNNGSWKHHGDAIDIAFLSMTYKMKLDPKQIKNDHPIIGSIPYESENKYSCSFYIKEDQRLLAAKGAVETILSFCTHMQTQKGTIALDKASVEKMAYQMANEGLRVLAIAGGKLQNNTSSPEETQLQNLCLYGLIGFNDPLRQEAKDAIKKCQKAGIKVLMITGDHPSTARSIAIELGLIDRTNKIVSGKALTEAGPSDSPAYEDLVNETSIFARVSPSQKFEIVDNLIRRGEFVAVTGDGVNDTPALRRANIGVAMGSGTDAAKEIGSMIIVDDNFNSIVSGIEEGRYAYDNVRKVIYLLISTGAAEVVLFIAAIISSLPLPLLAVQLLWLNLVTNGIQDVALAFEGGEPGAMKRKPRKPNEKIFNGLMISQTLTSGITMGGLAFTSWYWLIEIQHFEETTARNILLLLLVLLQNVHVFNCRSEVTSAFNVPIKRNYLLVFGVLLAQGIHILSMQLPFMQKTLKLEPVSFQQWGAVLILALLLLAAMEIFKGIRKQFMR